MKIPSVLKPSKRKIIILSVLVLAVILGFNFFGRKEETPLQFAEVKKQDIKAIVSSSGTLTGKNTANLKFKSSGKLAYLNVKAGDKVYAGQVIAGLDTQDLNIALQQARNTLTDKQATVDKIHDDVKGHDSDESFTQRQTRTTAEVAANNAYDAVKAAQRAFQDAVIISPIEGIVTQAIQVTGQTIGGADLIAQIVDTSNLYFDTDVDEADLSKVSLRLRAEITLDAYPENILKGTVDQVIPQTKTTSSGATVVTVRIKLEDSTLTFVNGLTGQASIINTEVKDALTIPQEALRDDNTVIIQAKGGLKFKKVTPGIRSDIDVEIKENLSEGEKVLLNPPSSGLPNRNRGPLRGFFRFRTR